MTIPRDNLDDWIGRAIEAEDSATPRLVAAFHATLAPYVAPLEDGIVPLGIHWCLAPDLVETRLLSTDGLPAVGSFMPPVELPRRMWASGLVEFLAPLREGDHVRRRSTIHDINRKDGRSGPLCFVTVMHELENALGPVIRELQVIVYRGAGEAPSEPATVPVTMREADWTIAIDPVLLFRYSALTFNGHRIHYDTPYAVENENYPGLVVHGPLQATLLLNLAAAKKGPPVNFSFRALRAATGCHPLHASAEFGDGNSISLAMHTQNGMQTMQAEANVGIMPR